MKKSSNSLGRLVDMLNDGHYHDGTSIGVHCNTSRNAVWKSIKKLEKYGINILCSKNKGYALAEQLILLNQQKILPAINADIELDIFESLNSTNSYLKNFYSHTIKPKVCLAEQMTNGRGRLNRQWYSPFAQNLYYSMLYTFNQDLSELAGLSLMVSIVVQETLDSLQLSDKFGIKWPNDIVYDQQKIAGILIEVQAESHGICHVIIGIGINVNMQEVPNEHITQPWTSLRKITQQYYDRNLLCVQLTNRLLAAINLFSTAGLSAFIEKWRAADCLYGKNLSLNYCNSIITGRAQGINNKGHLILELNDGSKQEYSSGDVSIIKTASH